MVWHMSKKPLRVMTARQFAERMGVNYRTTLNWLEAGLVPGAARKPSPVGEYWEIPETAQRMARPKPGPKPATVAPPAKRRSRRAA